MSPAIAKMERRLAALDARIDQALGDAGNLPADWEMLVARSSDLVERIIIETVALRHRSDTGRRAA